MALGIVFGVLLGATVGMAVGRWGRARGGACPIACNPYGGALFGALLGGLIAAAAFPGTPSYTPSPHLVRIESAEAFQAEVLESEVPVLVDFYTTWCPPCRRMEPHLHAVADRFAGRARVAKVDAQKLAGVARQYGVDAVPTLVVFVAGREVERVAGYLGEDKLTLLLEHHLPPPGGQAEVAAL